MGRRPAAGQLVRRTLRTIAVAAAGIALVLSVGATPAEAYAPERPLRVMTRNLYLGADLGPALARNRPADVPGRGGAHLCRQGGDRLRGPGRGDRRGDPDHRPRSRRTPGGSHWETSARPALSRPGGLSGRARRGARRARAGLRVASVSDNAVIGPVPLVSPCASPTPGACSLTFTDRDVILVNEQPRGCGGGTPYGNFTDR